MRIATRIAAFARDTLTLPAAPTGSQSRSDMATGIVTVVLGAAIAAFLFLGNPYFRPFEAYILTNCVVLFWAPCVVIMGFLRQTPGDFGFVAGDRRIGWTWTVVAYAIMLPLLIAAAHMPSFSAYYLTRLMQPLAMVGSVYHPMFHPRFGAVALIYYESVMGCYLFCWEFFFRGFLLFGLARFRRIGTWGAIVLQAVPFTLLHWSLVSYASKPPAEIASAFVGGILLGVLAMRTRTFYYGFLIHWSIAATLDVLLLAGTR